MGPSRVAVVRLEHQDLVRCHVGKPAPAMVRVVPVSGCLELEVTQSTHLGDGHHGYGVVGTYRARVADGQREVLRRRRYRAPHVVERPAVEVAELHAGHHGAEPLGLFGPGPLGHVGVGVARGLGVLERRQLLGRRFAVSLLAAAEHYHPGRAGHLRQKRSHLLGVLGVDLGVLLDLLQIGHRGRVRHQLEALAVERGTEATSAVNQNRLARQHLHRRQPLVLGHERQSRRPGRRSVPHVVDLCSHGSRAGVLLHHHPTSHAVDVLRQPSKLRRLRGDRQWQAGSRQPGKVRRRRVRELVDRAVAPPRRLSARSCPGG